MNSNFDRKDKKGKIGINTQSLARQVKMWGWYLILNESIKYAGQFPEFEFKNKMCG